MNTGISQSPGNIPLFVWTAIPVLVGSHPNRETDTDSSPKGKPRMQETVVLHFRRPRTISSKAELTRLQRNFDSCVAELKALERDKTMPATIAALAVGILGTAFMAGATFAAVAEPPSSG